MSLRTRIANTLVYYIAALITIIIIFAFITFAVFAIYDFLTNIWSCKVSVEFICTAAMVGTGIGITAIAVDMWRRGEDF
ncbi:hypothetical protein EJ02DRAFT_457936 [Clathrospora elynae]|uniref:Uncharacterized protein n=1 Tax=Clathrospora elynae TaxID=706981 RepID=A0A6A5SCM8_9PLEO|nr:hypothetical protein EJ02DRAFT_457936 [Clathrospora elynae]